MTNVWRHAVVLLAALACMWTGRGEAGVVIGGTRVIYPGQNKDVTVMLENVGKRPRLVQAWMNRADDSSAPDKAKVPFTLTPPVFRLDPGKGQAIRVLYSKEPLPQDKETLFWFNVLEVPPKAKSGDGGVMQFAVRTRIKLLFRPQGLQGSADTAPEQLSWRIVPDQSGKGVALQASNPTPYYVNFTYVGVGIDGRNYEHPGGGMVAPRTSAMFPIPDLNSLPSNDVKAIFETINDFGAVGKHQKPVGP
ncbi:MAG TPA: fimbria/pilus periplasmic chaperone [Dyella sp.]|uniref:fimbrial biogenesis chaperone n=1 Tax=Dyella sp. TaxID=1869338 RepID=UPI002CE1D9DF|nr:fimbria/pilus periplasmic chaperone [Dyella sp.]HTV87264.1 fimbria/pilus periplasmic chaperone [Dyella sp.]